MWWSIENIKVFVGTNKLWILIHSLSSQVGQTYGGLLETLIMLRTEFNIYGAYRWETLIMLGTDMMMFTICVLVITGKGRNQTCCTLCRMINLKGWLKELLTQYKCVVFRWITFHKNFSVVYEWSLGRPNAMIFYLFRLFFGFGDILRGTESSHMIEGGIMIGLY